MMRRTEYDVAAAAEAIDAGSFPIPRFGEEHVLTVPGAAEAQARFEQMGAERRSRS